MFSVKVTFSIDSTCQLYSIVVDAAIGFEVRYSNDLLIKLTGSIVQTAHRTNISLIDVLILANLRVRQVSPVVTP